MPESHTMLASPWPSSGSAVCDCCQCRLRFVWACHKDVFFLQALIRKYLPIVVILSVVLLIFLVKHWLMWAMQSCTTYRYTYYIGAYWVWWYYKWYTVASNCMYTGPRGASGEAMLSYECTWTQSSTLVDPPVLLVKKQCSGRHWQLSTSSKHQGEHPMSSIVIFKSRVHMCNCGLRIHHHACSHNLEQRFRRHQSCGFQSCQQLDKYLKHCT